jgi:glycosyltransferase involved in cell wall biosynthesis
LQPKKYKHYVIDLLNYVEIVDKEDIDLFITIEYYLGYENILKNFPTTPCLIWIKDPRDEAEWKKISELPLEIRTYNKNTPEEFMKMLVSDSDSIKRLVRSNLFRRKVIFATQAHSLVEIAKRAYGLDNINPIFLPNPIRVPQIKKPTYSTKPSVLFLGRLEPIKRPWIYFELAKRFPKVDFYVAGKAHFPDLMNPIIERYQDIPNLIFLGMTTGHRLEELLDSVWAVVNTSVHEALPVSFLEAFSYYKPVISCQNVDNLTSKYGVYTGELSGEGYDDETVDRFSHALEKVLSKSFDKESIGIAARRYVETTHNFSNYERIINEVLDNL